MDKKKIIFLGLGAMAVLFSINAFAMMGHSGNQNSRGDFNHYRSYQQDHMNGYYSDHHGNNNTHMEGNDHPNFNHNGYNEHMDQQHRYYQGDNPENHMGDGYYRRGDDHQSEPNRYRIK